MKTNALTVIQLLPALNSGGVERGTLEIARALVNSGHRSIVISNGGRLVAPLEAAGSTHITLPIHRKSLRSLAQIPVLTKFFHNSKAQIVHARSRMPAWLTYWALKQCPSHERPAFITTVHGLYSVNPYSRIMTRGDHVITVSDVAHQYVRSNYPNCSAERLSVIHRGVATEDFPADYRPSGPWATAWQRALPGIEKQKVLTLAGRISPRKGHEHFIRLIATLKKQEMPVCGLIVGGVEPKKAAYLRHLQQQVDDAGLNETIHFLGLRDDIRDIFAVSDIVLSLSDKPESFGRIAIEALALGTPVVGWQHGGIGEILAELYPDGAITLHDTDALHQTITHILKQTQPASIPPLPPHFKLQAMCDNTLALYRQAAEQQFASS